MTEERKTPDPGVADDPRVSDIYRDVASERTPDHLDRAVLREAARAVRPRYSRLRLWTRPAAWAAIVLLSATLLLQVSQVQPPQSDLVPGMVELDDAAAKRELAEPEAAAERQREEAGRAAKATGTAAPQQQREPAAELLEEAASQDADMLIRADEMARVQQGPDDAPATPAATSPNPPQAAETRAYSSLGSLEEAQPFCDATARALPEDWLDCITDLEERGYAAAAEQERRLLAEAFPDFETP